MITRSQVLQIGRNYGSMFSDTNFLMFCGRRVWGYLFDKDLD